MLWVCPPIIIQITSISHTKGQYFNRAPNFIQCAQTLYYPEYLKFARRNTPQNLTPFLQNSSQWLLLNVSYLFRKAKRKTVFIPLLCLIQLKSCNCIKIEKQPLEASCKKGVLRNFAKFTGKHLCQESLF